MAENLKLNDEELRVVGEEAGNDDEECALRVVLKSKGTVPRKMKKRQSLAEEKALRCALGGKGEQAG